MARRLARGGVLAGITDGRAMTPNSRPVCPTEASFSVARLCGQVTVRKAGHCHGGKITLVQMGEAARMLGPRSSAVTVGSSQSGRTVSRQLLFKTSAPPRRE